MLQSTYYKAWILDFSRSGSTTTQISVALVVEVKPCRTAPPHLSITRSLQDVYTHSRILGVPWRLTKWYDFADVFTHLGLLWDLTNRTVDLPDEKRRKYLHKIADLLAVLKGYHRVSCKDAMSIDSTLSHVAFVIPYGRITCQTCPHSSRSTRRDMLYAARSLGHFGPRMVA
jgi:hypothetical protein